MTEGVECRYMHVKCEGEATGRNEYSIPMCKFCLRLWKSREPMDWPMGRLK
jgi:hypothetical protein